jgi:hypothetical protein
VNHCLLVEVRPADHVVVVGRLRQGQVVVVSALVCQVGWQILESLGVIRIVITMLLVKIEYFNPIPVKLTLPETLFSPPILYYTPESLKLLTPILLSLLIVVVKVSLHLSLNRCQIVSLNHFLDHRLVPLTPPIVINVRGDSLG